MTPANTVMMIVEARIRQYVEEGLPLAIGRDGWREFLAELERLRRIAGGVHVAIRDLNIEKAKVKRQAALLADIKAHSNCLYRDSYESLKRIREAIVRFDAEVRS